MFRVFVANHHAIEEPSVPVKLHWRLLAKSCALAGELAPASATIESMVAVRITMPRLGRPLDQR